MVERSLKYISKTCAFYGSCKYIWKVWGCEATDKWQIFHNRADHVREESVECGGPHKAAITAEMKKIILQQDECAIPPQLILSNLRRLSDSIAPPRGYPTIQQVSNCDKYLRRFQGTKNSIQAVKRLVREHAFNPTGDANQSFIFSYHDGADGYSCVGKATKGDSYCIGITCRSHVNTCIDYCTDSRITLFYADATFKLSDIGYPIINCEFSDASRTYQLAAIFVVSRRTAQEYSMCMSAFIRVVKRVRPTASLSIDAVMGGAEDAQVSGFQQVAEFASATFLMCFFSFSV
ncbi:hypothetical protein JG688_00017541 [Phytophthora aleatoria]|uniref:MULE transposase domain-containing protein n=1 Tax=Phytophthora aleatoria TaxID=2496075 RepID=A0A8J5I0Q5_9STRA|nr:hypothetical protein JG688_00017541 [Phytophthora aleatoria]